MQALMLAAGMGQRLGKYTQACTKCMIEVGGRTLLERTVEALKIAGIQKFILVVGWEHETLIDYIEKNITGIDFQFIYNHDYATTNNIYSLYLARELLAQDDTILLESDLVFDKHLLKDMVQSPEKNLVAVAKYEQWMDGTVTLLSPDGTIQEFVEKKDFLFQNAGSYYKTVNIYKFSKEFSKSQYLPFLEAYITAYGKKQYYELVLKALAHLSNAHLKAFVLNDVPWYEIDDAQDLDIANTIFAPTDDKLIAYEYHYGGYWRFSKLIDFCYLVNPYFPPKKMLDQIKYFFDPLLTQYPSGMSIQKLIAGKMFKVEEEFLLVGNGAAELINTLGRILKGKIAVSIPSFNEYIRCFKDCEIMHIPASENGFQLNKNALIKAADTADSLIIINPDNPSGAFLTLAELTEILEHCKSRGTCCIVDESFIDFAEKDLRYTLLDNAFLKEYPNLVIIKSISKSYGVPGLRLGVLATSDLALLKKLQGYLPIWNINSFAEYFLQIFSLYADSFIKSCDEIAKQRTELERLLKTISFLKVYPSQANFVMCEVYPPYHSKAIATELLEKYNLLIKDLSQKQGFGGKQYIRVAVKNAEENFSLYKALKSLEKDI